jgi:hypothetical protein
MGDLSKKQARKEDDSLRDKSKDIGSGDVAELFHWA